MSRKSVRSSAHAFTHTSKDRGTRRHRRQYRVTNHTETQTGSILGGRTEGTVEVDLSSGVDLRSTTLDLQPQLKVEYTLSPSNSLAIRPLSVLLGSAAYGGTLAAVRQLGSAGLNVNILSSPRLAPAAWSRFGSRSYVAPLESETDNFLERILEIGKLNPGQILLPSSDETAWLYSANSEKLSRYFYLNQPPVETMRRILDKKLFAEAVSAAGLNVLPTWEPQNFEHVMEIAGSLPYPILIKPRTHVHRLRNDKGMVVRSKAELISEYQQFVDREQHRGADTPHLPDAGLPVLQQFVNVAEEGVCSVSGYIDRTGELFVTRRSTKVLQRSQPVGVGVCFEALPQDEELSNSVRRLCRELGYFGMFEVEFLRSSVGWAPIDFNGRLFNQLGLDVRRNMPLPLFACLEAIGDRDGLRKAIEKAKAEDNDDKSVFYDRFTLSAIMTARALSGRISREERNYWNNWVRRHKLHCVDVAADKNDRMPGLVHVVSEIYLGFRALPRFLRSIPKVSSAVASALVKAHS